MKNCISYPIAFILSAALAHLMQQVGLPSAVSLVPMFFIITGYMTHRDYFHHESFSLKKLLCYMAITIIGWLFHLLL